MDQDLYYNSSYENEEFQKFLNESQLNFDLFLDECNENNNINYQNNILKTHIDNLHLIIYEEIKKKGINNKFLFELKSEITKFNLKICNNK